MTSPSYQNRDPQPLGRGGEVVVVALAGGVLLLLIAALAGVGAAGALLGGGWVWPASTDTAGPVLGGLFSGHPGQGLPPAQAGLLPGPGTVYSCVVITELLTLTLAAVAAVLFSRYRRPTDARRGMATRTEATDVLGLGRLRSSKAIIRPDLYSRHSQHDKQAAGAGGSGGSNGRPSR